MDFLFDDLIKEAQDNLRETHKLELDLMDADDAIAYLSFPSTRNSAGRISGEWDSIIKLIPILKEMGYDDLHLRYEDCDIWILEWHNPRHDGRATWRLCDGY